jgi:hypothetical protein
MASISGKNSTYKDGHKVQFKSADKLSANVLSQIKKINYVPDSTVFSLIRTVTKTTKADYLIEVTKTGDEQIYLKDPRGKVVILTGSGTSIDGCFNHAGGSSSKADTNVKTEVKELVSMWVFEASLEKGAKLTEKQVMDKLGSNKIHYSTVYYDSAYKQLEVLKKNVIKGGYIYERQRDNITSPLYDMARKLSGKANDNWNPADVWMIKKTFSIPKMMAKVDNIATLNNLIADAIKKKDLVPISLKQVEGKAKAKYSIIDPESSGDDIDIDFSFDKVDLSDSFNNFILFTKGGFNIRVGYKASSTNFGVYLEGRMTGAKSQIGAVDKKAFVEMIKQKYTFDVRSGSSAPPVSEHKLAKAEFKKVFDKYKRISNKILTEKEGLDLYTKGDAAIKGRFSNIVSFLYAMTTLPATPKEFKELMRYCYLSAKKITGGACMYVLINEA